MYPLSIAIVRVHMNLLGWWLSRIEVVCIFASIEVFKLVKICEQIFREVVVNKPMSSGNVLLRLKVATQRWIHENKSPIFVQVAHANPLALGEISHEGQLVRPKSHLLYGEDTVAVRPLN